MGARAWLCEVAIKEMSTTATASFIDQWHRAYEGQSDDADERAELRSAPANLKRLLEPAAQLAAAGGQPAAVRDDLCAAPGTAQQPADRADQAVRRVHRYAYGAARCRGVASHRKITPRLEPRSGWRCCKDLAYRMMRNGEIEIAAETATDNSSCFCHAWALMVPSRNACWRILSSAPACCASRWKARSIFATVPFKSSSPPRRSRQG